MNLHLNMLVVNYKHLVKKLASLYQLCSLQFQNPIKKNEMLAQNLYLLINSTRFHIETLFFNIMTFRVFEEPGQYNLNFYLSTYNLLHIISSFFFA